MSNVPATQVDNPFSGAPVVNAPSASGHALATRESTHIQTAMMLAERFPRNPREAVDRILVACTRPALAEEAVYQYARGGTDITGPSIRLAEEMARSWRNLMCGLAEVSRSTGMSEVRAYAWDLEGRFCDEKIFHVKHWRDTRGGGYALTDERDIYELIANMGARRKRACILACIPGDVTAAALAQCEQTLAAKAEVTPERLRAMLEKFATYHVTQEMIESRIQRRLDALSPAGLIALGKIHNALRDGLGKVTDYFEPVQASGQEGRTQTESIKETLRAGKGAAQPAAKGRKKDEVEAATGASHEGRKEGGTEVPVLELVGAACKRLEVMLSVDRLDAEWSVIVDEFREAHRTESLESVTGTYDTLRRKLSAKESGVG